MLNRLFVVVAIMFVGMIGTAHADEKLMVLWPKQRTAHQETMNQNSAAYEARGRAYVDHLYETGGETPIEPEPDLVSEIEPVPINVGQVANMVKSADAVAQQPSPSAQTAATPQ